MLVSPSDFRMKLVITSGRVEFLSPDMDSLSRALASYMHKQGSYASGKCQGNFNFFKVRELSVNFMLCQGKMNVF